MALFKYKARNGEGKTVGGTVEAHNLSAFYEALARDNLLCLSVTQVKDTKEKARAGHTPRLGNKELVLFCRKLSTMFASGMSIINCLDIIASSTEKPKQRKLYMSLYEQVKGGKPLSDAMREFPDSFPTLLVNMLQSGEESGNVEGIMEKLALYYERQNKISSKIKTATIYPKILAVVALLVIVVLFTFVLPTIFKTFGTNDLPAITQFMLNVSNFLTGYWYICIAVAMGGYFGIKYLMKLPEVKLLKDKKLLTMPVIGKLLKKIYSARFASTLAILYSSGLSLINALRLSMNVIGNTYIEATLAETMENISMGQSLSETIGKAEVFDKLLSSMISVGEQSGSLDTVLNSVSEFYDEETVTAIEQLLAMLEPFMLVVMAIIIGMVLISVILPIFGSYSNIS